MDDDDDDHDLNDPYPTSRGPIPLPPRGSPRPRPRSSWSVRQILLLAFSLVLVAFIIKNSVTDDYEVKNADSAAPASYC